MKWLKICSPLIVLYLVVFTSVLPSEAKGNELPFTYSATDTTGRSNSN